MNIILKHILRNIRAHKGRSILIVFALVIATAVLVLNITLGDEIATKYEKTLRSIYGESDISVSIDVDANETDTLARELKPDQLKLDETKIESMVVTNIGGYSMINGEGMQTLIMGFDLHDAFAMDEFCKDSIDLKENELVVNEKTAKKYKIHKGDTFEFTHDDQEYTMKVVDIVANYRLTALEYDYPFFVSNLETVNKMVGFASGSGQQMFINVEDSEKIPGLNQYIIDNNPNVSSRELVNRESIDEDLSSITSLLTIILVIVIIMIFFVVGSLNKLVIAERFPVIGTFRSIGATKGKMNWILIGENAVYGLFGGILGSIAGYAINSVVAKAFISTDGVELATDKAGINWGVFFGGVLFAILLEVVISLKAILRANRKPIKDIIFNVQSTRYKINKKKSWIGFGLIIVALVLQLTNNSSNFLQSLVAMAIITVGTAFLVPVWLRFIAKGITVFSRKIGWKSGIIASKNIGYSKTIISAATLMVVSISSILSVNNVSVSFSRLFESFRYNNDFNVVIQGLSKEYEEYSYINDMEEVESTKPLYYIFPENATYNDEKKFNITPVFMVADKDNLVGVEIDDSDFDLDSLKDNEILIDSYYAEKNDIRMGDKLAFVIDDKKWDTDMTVVGTVNSAYFTTNRNVIMLSKNAYIKGFTKIPVWIQVYLKDGVDEKAFIDKLKDEVKEFNVSFMTFKEYIDVQEEQTNGIMSIFYVLIGMAVILSFVGIVNNQVIGFIQRKREIAVLNSTCMSKGQIRRMLFTETLLTSVISGVIACIVVIPTIYMVNTAMQGLSMYMNIGYNLLPSIEFVAIVVAILLLTTLIPLRKLRKMNVVSEIKYE